MSRSDLIPYGVLLLRVALGFLFLAHGLLKLLVHKPAGTAAYFRSLGLPGFVGYLTMEVIPLSPEAREMLYPGLTIPAYRQIMRTRPPQMRIERQRIS